MIVHLEARSFEVTFNMDYIEVWFLTEDEKITSLKLMNNEPTDDNFWLKEFFKYCEAPGPVVQ